MGKDRRYVLRALALRALRSELGKTQADVARAATMTQGAVSRLEASQDIKLSTIGRYASALGGTMEVVVVVGERRYQLDLELKST